MLHINLGASTSFLVASPRKSGLLLSWYLRFLANFKCLCVPLLMIPVFALYFVNSSNFCDLKYYTILLSKLFTSSSCGDQSWLSSKSLVKSTFSFPSTVSLWKRMLQSWAVVVSFSNILPRIYFVMALFFTYDQSPHKSLCRMFSVSDSINSFNSIITDPSIRLVYIASPHSTHAQYAVDCLSSGKDVYIEKPIAVSLEQLSSLRNVQYSTGRNLYVGFNRPHSPFIKAIRHHYWLSFFCSMVV